MNARVKNASPGHDRIAEESGSNDGAWTPCSPLGDAGCLEDELCSFLNAFSLSDDQERGIPTGVTVTTGGGRSGAAFPFRIVGEGSALLVRVWDFRGRFGNGVVGHAYASCM